MGLGLDVSFFPVASGLGFTVLRSIQDMQVFRVGHTRELSSPRTRLNIPCPRRY